jgi:hypothetical protein
VQTKSLGPAEQALRLMTLLEAAAFLRISHRTLERHRVTGTGPRYLKAGPGKQARVLYRAADLETWISKFSYASTSEYGR